MTDIVDRNLFGLTINFIDNPIITDTQTIESFGTLQLCGLGWIWIDRQAVDAV
jgi:hypothetical protein